MAKKEIVSLGRKSKLIEKILKNSSVNAQMLNESSVMQEVTPTKTRIPMLNIALGGKLDGGVTRGITMLAGPSKHFKTSFALEIIGSYLEAHPDAILLFYDNEFGAKKQYFEQFGVDTDRVIHSVFENIEQLKFDLVKQLTEFELGDEVIVLIDSIGNAASKKEIDDTMEQKSTADMTRAKQLKSLFRMITPKLYLKNIPLFAINHTYKTQSLYPVDVVGGGEGGVYSSDNIFIIGKNQLKESDELTGFKFVIKMFKSRTIKEKSVFPITVRFEGGIAKWSGFDEVAEQLGVIEKTKIGKSVAYKYDSISKGEIVVLAKKIDVDDDFWELVLKETDLQHRMEALYQFGVPTRDKLVFDTSEIDTIIEKAISVEDDE